MKKCVIIGGADINNYERARSFISKDDYVIYCDSGLRHMEGLSIAPSLVIGDFDSHENPHLDVETIVLPVAKDDTDTMLAARRAGIDTVVIPGENRKDLEKIPRNVRSAIRVIPVEDVHEVLRVALERMPGEEPLPVEELPAGSLEVPGNTLA